MSTTESASDLARKRCRACQEEAGKLDDAAVNDLLRQVPNWRRNGQEILREFKFKDYYQTMAFVNAIAWMAHGENHHPDLAVGYNTCTAIYSTHSVGGLTENDFICAAKVDALLVGN